MVALRLVEPNGSVAHTRWFARHSCVGELNTALKHYDRDGRIFNSESLRWAARRLWNSYELLITRPHLSPANLLATPAISVLLTLAEGPLRTNVYFPKDRLQREFNALSVSLLDDFLTWLALPGRCQAQGGRGAPRHLGDLQARLGYEAVDQLYPALLRLGGAFQALRPPQERIHDLQQLSDALTRAGALRAGQIDTQQGDLLAGGLAASYARAERETGAMATFRRIMHLLEHAYARLTTLMLLPENAGDADFHAAKCRWVITGECSAPGQA